MVAILFTIIWLFVHNYCDTMILSNKCLVSSRSPLTKRPLIMSKKSLETTAIATVNNATATVNKSVKNTDKVNKTVNVNDVYTVFVNAVNGVPCKLNFSDAKSQPYCGLPHFSVNMKKTGFMVYMNENNATICTDIDNTLTVNVNDCDTTKNGLRNRSIKFSLDKYDTLVKCINAVVTATVH